MSGDLTVLFPTVLYSVNAKIYTPQALFYKAACSWHGSMSKVVFAVKYMSNVWGSIRCIKPQDSASMSVTSLFLEKQHFLTLLSYTMIKRESVYRSIAAAVKLSRTHVQRSGQHVIYTEQFIYDPCDSWWAYQAQEGFQRGTSVKDRSWFGISDLSLRFV